MGDDPPPLPNVRLTPLLRGPLILTAISRVLMIPFYFLCALGSSANLKTFFNHLAYYRGSYIVDMVALTASLWTFFWFSVLLAWLFFSRRRMFRPMMTYFSLLPFFLLIGVGIHAQRFKPHHRTHSPDDPYAAWLGFGLMLTVFLWPFYYGFSPRVKRVFRR